MSEKGRTQESAYLIRCHCNLRQSCSLLVSLLDLNAHSGVRPSYHLRRLRCELDRADNDQDTVCTLACSRVHERREVADEGGEDGGFAGAFERKRSGQLPLKCGGVVDGVPVGALTPRR